MSEEEKVHRECVRQLLADFADEHALLTADGFDEAIVGIATRRVSCKKCQSSAHEPVVVYSAARCVEILMARDGMSEEDAEEFFDFNTAGAFVGPKTPIFLHDLRSPFRIYLKPRA